jgi:hypothetical protein
MCDGMTQVRVHKLQKLEDDYVFVKELSELMSFFKPKLPRGSSSLKQALLIQFKILESTRNLHFQVI